MLVRGHRGEDGLFWIGLTARELFAVASVMSEADLTCAGWRDRFVSLCTRLGRALWRVYCGERIED